MASYKIKSTLSCPDEIKVKLKDNVVKLIEFNGGCSVINQAITKLSANRNIDELIELLSDIREPCVNKKSCISQLTELLIHAKEEEIKKEEADRQYKLTPDGLYDGITTLLSKTNLNVDKDAITIRVKKHLYNKIENSVNEIKDKINCELYIEEFNDFNGDYIFKTCAKKTTNN